MKRVVIIILTLVSFIHYAQELNATVTVNMQNLPVVNKESLVNFASAIQDYLNQTRFTGEEWPYEKINCSFTISIASAVNETNYNAAAVVVSQRKIYKSQDYSPMLKVFDNNWNFSYEKNQSFYFDPLVFNSVTSFLDYYAFIIIGLENDSWEKLNGTMLFNKAFDITNLGINSSFSDGWASTSGNYNRRDLAENLLNEKYRPFREAFADYHYGIDFYVKNKKTGQEKIVSAIKVIEGMKSKIDVKSILVKSFFDAKFGEIIDRLIDYQDKNIFKVLKSIDPPHTAKYDEAMRAQ